MKISPETIQVLKNFSTINTSILIKPGNIIATKNADATVVASAEVPETFEDTIAIFDLPQFLNVWGMFSDPRLEISGGKQARIVEDKAVARYTFAEPSLIPQAPSRLAEQEVVASFTVPSDKFQRLLKSGIVMGLEDISIKGTGTNLVISALTKKSVSSNSFDMLVGDSDREFVANMKMALMVQLVKDYKITVTAKYARFDAELSDSTLTRLTYWVGIEHDSKF